MSYGELLSLSLGGFVLFGLGALPAGWLGDRWSAERMMVVFFVGTGGAAIATGLAGSPFTVALGLAAIGVALLCMVHSGNVIAAPVDRRPEPPTSRRDAMRTFIVLSFTMLADGTVSQAIPVALPKAFAAGLTGLTDGGTLDAGGFVTLVFLVAATAQLAGGWLADRFAMKAVYILAWAVQAPLFFAAAQARDVPLLAAMMAVNYLGVLATPAENALLARYTPAKWRATAYGAKFLLALGVSTIGVKLMSYDSTGSFATLWLALGGCAGFVALAGLFLPGRLRRAPLLAPQPAE
jgi:MFS transporter, FSR family, fosmidomycin resistance protein